MRAGFLLLIFLWLNTVFFSCSSSKVDLEEKDTSVEKEKLESTTLNLTTFVPAGANSWVVGDLEQDRLVVSETGIHNWSETSDVIRSYIGVSNSGELHLGFKAKSSDGDSKIKVTVGSLSKEIMLTSKEYSIIEIGKFQVTAGYVLIEIEGLEKSGTYIGDISDILVGGPATVERVTNVPTDNFYFGRRGPSVNFSYQTPQEKDVLWFYNEITVPEGSDVLGSYFMANGFAEGYFGIQVNSDTERRVLFSLWSPFVTDNPDEIPEKDKIKLLGNGNGVVVGEFGNEGSGGQSFLRYNWTADTTYKFLLKGKPSDNDSTDYTAYFYAPETGKWKLIASFKRPNTTTYLKRLHSFLENFVPSTGYITRQAKYSNQWVYTTDNTWNEITNVSFGVDATASNGHRSDFAGGLDNDTFFLKNCGFFDESTTVGVGFTRASTGIKPSIDFNVLETPMLKIQPSFLDKTDWKISSFSSEEITGEGDLNGRAKLLIDNDTDTYWHTCWTCNSDAVYPHEFVIDLNSTQTIEGIAFSQRSNLSRSVKKLEILISTDNLTWESLGDFTLQNNSSIQELDFGEEILLKYVKVISKSSYDGKGFAAIAEVSPYVR